MSHSLSFYLFIYFFFFFNYILFRWRLSGNNTGSNREMQLERLGLSLKKAQNKINIQCKESKQEAAWIAGAPHQQILSFFLAFILSSFFLSFLPVDTFFLSFLCTCHYSLFPDFLSFFFTCRLSFFLSWLHFFFRSPLFAFIFISCFYSFILASCLFLLVCSFLLIVRSLSLSFFLSVFPAFTFSFVLVFVLSF